MISQYEIDENDVEEGEEFELRYAENEYEKQGDYEREGNKELDTMTRPTIQEVPNPAYVKDQKQRRRFVPYRGSILSTSSPAQPSLKEQMSEGYQRYETDALLRIREFCSHCFDCEDCAYFGEMRAMTDCRIVMKEMKK